VAHIHTTLLCILLSQGSIRFHPHIGILGSRFLYQLRQFAKMVAHIHTSVLKFLLGNLLLQGSIRLHPHIGIFRSPFLYQLCQLTKVVAYIHTPFFGSLLSQGSFRLHPHIGILGSRFFYQLRQLTKVVADIHTTSLGILNAQVFPYPHIGIFCSRFFHQLRHLAEMVAHIHTPYLGSHHHTMGFVLDTSQTYHYSMRAILLCNTYNPVRKYNNSSPGPQSCLLRTDHLSHDYVMVVPDDDYLACYRRS